MPCIGANNKEIFPKKLKKRKILAIFLTGEVTSHVRVVGISTTTKNGLLDILVLFIFLGERKKIKEGLGRTQKERKERERGSDRESETYWRGT